MKLISTMLLLGSLLWATPVWGQAAKYTISGQIQDAASGEDLPFVNIVVMNQPGVGTTTNTYGFYSITLEEGTHTLLFQYVGYQNQERQVTLTTDQRLDVELGENIQVLGEVVVSAEREDQNITRNEGSVAKIDMQEVRSIATFGGEPDIIQVIKLQPGIKSAGEGNSGYYVRGGGLDQNLILLDEAPVYNPSHLLGFFSVFNGDALRGATVYKGGMPAEYGGRTASVMDIRKREGNQKTYGVSGGIGLLSARLTAEGPIVQDKGAFIISGRRTYADLFLGFSDDFENSNLYFYDLNAKANYRLDDKNKLYLSGYFGRDNFGFEDIFGLNWGNATATLRWNHLFSDRLFSNTTIIYSNYDYEFGFGLDEDRLAVQSIIRDWNFKQDFSFFPSTNHTLKFGLNLIHHTIEPGNLQAGSNTGVTAEDAEEKQGLEGAIYIQNQQQISERLNLNYGLRYTWFNQLGPGQRYTLADDGEVLASESFDAGENMQFYGGLAPRLSVNYLLNDKSSIKLGYNRNYQFIHLLTNATSATPTDVWIMSSNNVEPQIADQVSLGYFRNFKNNTYEASIEAYYKDMQNVIDYRNGADVFFNEQLESDLLSGDGEAYGVEFLLKKNKGRLTGWISYTWSRTFRQIDGINNGEKFSARQDRIHDLAIVALYKLNAKLSLSANFIFNTGDAVTYPTGRYRAIDTVVPVYTERNAGRMPNNHRLDVGLNWQTKKTKRYEASWNFSIYNIYGRENAYSISFEPNEDNPQVTEAVQLSLFRWVPSVTYNFKF